MVATVKLVERVPTKGHRWAVFTALLAAWQRRGLVVLGDEAALRAAQDLRAMGWQIDRKVLSRRAMLPEVKLGRKLYGQVFPKGTAAYGLDRAQGLQVRKWLRRNLVKLRPAARAMFETHFRDGRLR